MSGSNMPSCSTCTDASRADKPGSLRGLEFPYERRQDSPNAGHDNQGEAVSAPKTGFRLLHLPAELRYRIYSFVLPNNITIKFEATAQRDGEPHFAAYALQQHGQAAHPIGGEVYDPHTRVRRANHITVETQLFRVSKAVSSETLSVLYGMNTYKFTVHGWPLWPKSMRSPHIFGSLGHPLRLSLLRNLRHIHIDVVPEIDSHWAVKRQRARLEYLVEILKEHADDDNQKSLLQDLKVDFRPACDDRRAQRRHFRRLYRQFHAPPRSAEKFMFGLESLASLRGIKDVQITGLPEWYAKCMQLCIQGKGGQVQETDWPRVQVKRRRGGSSTRKKTQWVTLRKWYQPMLNWKEFAQRNDIAVPDDIDRFWEAEDD